MSKITKKELQYQINGLAAEASTRHNSIMRIHRALASIGVDIFSDDFDLTEPEPQLKQLDQSVFNGLDEKWVAASVEENGTARIYMRDENNPYDCEYHLAGTKYDTSNWQNSLIERDIAKELLEVDLSGELTGSELCRAMLERGDKYVMCAYDNGFDNHPKAISVSEYGDLFYINGDYKYGVLCGNIYPINNQGEPLTASEVGF